MMFEFPWFWLWFLTLILSACPNPTAIALTACTAPEARTAPPAPALMAGIAGNEPKVMRIALNTLMARGCSLVRQSSALMAFRIQAGAWIAFTMNVWISAGCFDDWKGIPSLECTSGLTISITGVVCDRVEGDGLVLQVTALSECNFTEPGCWVVSGCIVAERLAEGRGAGWLLLLATSGCDDSRIELRLFDFLQEKRKCSFSTGSCSGSSVRLASDPLFPHVNHRQKDLVETLIAFFSSLSISPFKVGLVPRR